MRSLQDAQGCFCAYSGGESDMRFLYCATAICTMLRDDSWAGVDVRVATANPRPHPNPNPFPTPTLTRTLTLTLTLALALALSRRSCGRS